MHEVPEHRALLGVDVVASASIPHYHRSAVPVIVNELLDRALRRSGIDPAADVIYRECLGDGALLTLPSRWLGALLDVAHGLDAALGEHNRHRKPEIRLRIAVEVGPVGPEPGFYQAKIQLGRLLDAAEFKDLFDRCVAEQPELVNTGQLVSADAYRVVFGGDHTSLRRQDFAQLPVHHKEFSGTAWARVPGFDAHSLAQLAGSDSAAAEPDAGSGTHNQVVAEHVGGDVSTVQVRDLHGGVRFGSR